MSITYIWFKCSLMIHYNEMIQLFNQLIVPVPSDVNIICSQTTTSSSGSSTTVYYTNWGYAQVNAMILTSGQKYSIILQNPGFVTLNLGYYITPTYTIYTSSSSSSSSTSNPSSINFNYATFNLNEYNTYVGNTNINAYGLSIASFNSIATAYAYVDQNGFTIDLSDLPNNYAVILGLIKFDYIKQFTTYQSNNTTYNIYGMSTALNNVYVNSINSIGINTTTFLGIPVNTNIKFGQYNMPAPAVGYQLNDTFLINDEVVNNSAFNFPTEQSNVAIIPQATNALAQLASQTGSSQGFAGLISFGNSPPNITYYTIIYYTNGQYTMVTANDSSYVPGLPNTNAAIATDIILPLPYFSTSSSNTSNNTNIISLKSIYNNNGYNDIWIFSSNVTTCGSYIFPPFFTPYNAGTGDSFIQLNSNSPDILFQYIEQPPIVQISSSTTNITTTQSITSRIVQSSAPMEQASSSTTSTSTSTSTASTQSTTSTSSTTNVTITNITKEIVTALANPIVALILALALVGLAIFVLV